MTLDAVYALFDHLSDGVCLADAGGDVLYMNEVALRLLELKKSGRRLQNICELLCDKLETGEGRCAGSDCSLRRASKDVQSVTFVGRHGPYSAFNWRDDRVNRAERWNDLRVHCLRARLSLAGREKEELHVVLIEDGTAEMELKRHRADWRSMIAHDLRAPLTNIFGALNLIKETHAGQPESCCQQDAKLIDMSLKSCSRMLELLDLYLDIARFDAGGMAVKLADVDLAGLVDDVVDEQSALASSMGVLIEVDVAPRLNARADAELLRRVVQNLVNNALKYNVSGGSLKISAGAQGDSTLLSFKDTGQGIGAKDLPFIFDRYYQAAARRAGRIQGNGLGLTFCKEALDAMGGRISVESDPGKGTEFVVTLKAAAKDQADKELPTSSAGGKYERFESLEPGTPALRKADRAAAQRR